MSCYDKVTVTLLQQSFQLFIKGLLNVPNFAPLNSKITSMVTNGYQLFQGFITKCLSLKMT